MTGKIVRKKRAHKLNKTPDPRLKYNDNMPKRAYKLSLLGLTEEELALAFGVTKSTIDHWKNRYPEFAKMLIAGQTQTDAEVAAMALKKALGYEYLEEKAFNVNGILQTIKVKKHQPPDTRAFMYWLNNRQKKRWKSETSLRVGGDADNPIQVNHVAGKLENMDLSNLSIEELELAEKIGAENKQLIEDKSSTEVQDTIGDGIEIEVCDNCGFPKEICECIELDELDD